MSDDAPDTKEDLAEGTFPDLFEDHQGPPGISAAL